MAKKIIISESMAERIALNEALSSNSINKDEIVKIVRDALKDNRDVNKDLEKKVKALVAASVNTLFKTLWQRHNFYEDEIKK